MMPIIMILLLVSIICFYRREDFLDYESISLDKAKTRLKERKNNQGENNDTIYLSDVCQSLRFVYNMKRYNICNGMIIGRSNNNSDRRLNLVPLTGDKIINKNMAIVKKRHPRGVYYLSPVSDFHKKNQIYILNEDGSKRLVTQMNPVRLRPGLKIMFVKKKYILEVEGFDFTEEDNDRNEEMTIRVGDFSD